jgi:ELWxxDGT repeat protein
MKSKITFLIAGSLLYLALETHAQQLYFPKPNSSDQIPFGKKFPPQALNERDAAMAKMNDKKNRNLPTTLFDTALKQFVVTTPGSSSLQYRSLSSRGNAKSVETAAKPTPNPAGFHLTKDINTATTGSFPSNFPPNAAPTFAVLNNISYFTANDGIHNSELWRSDGTEAGTYLVKDIAAGGDSGTAVYGIIAANGLLFFSASTSEFGVEPWVSDGTEAGTHQLMDIYPGAYGSYPNQFVNVNGVVFFCVSSNGYNNQLWKTDGTELGTVLVKDLQQAGIGGNIFELTAVNNMAYFIAYTWNTGYQVFRSDGTDAGTYLTKDIGYNYYDYTAPMQLTAYNNKLYFSADDGTGRRLWESDGTYDGTHNATGFNDVFMQQDYLNIYSNRSFLILNNILYLAGFTNADGGGLYKYDASNADGIVLVMDFTPGTDVYFAVPVDMCIVNDVLYFKVISNTGDWHDELWSTKGETVNTQLVKSFAPGEYHYYLFNGGGTFYFVKYDNVHGNELWKSDGTGAGTLLVKDIIPGPTASFPEDLTFSGGKLLFRATDNNHGSELWSSDGTDLGTALVKDINHLYTEGSNAGFWYKGVGITKNGDALFNAFTPDLGGELYKSDGTTAGTVLLNDIRPGPDWSFPNAFQLKNNVTYFIDDDAVGTAIYKTDGTTAGLQRVTAYIDRNIYYVVNFNITDNGQVFYVLGYRNYSAYELWHSNGTDASGTMLNSFLYYYNNYTVIIGNTAYFQAGDFDHGYELWKSDGTLAGTKMVKDINPGYNGSYPYSLFAYKSNVYFGAYDGLGLNYSLWKSDGTDKGTVKLKNITPASFFENFADPASQVFCISNSTLYFTATDFNTYGAELWKTNGTGGGTTLVKDINPYYSSYPSNLTDVNGMLFFTADDGLHGNELWSTNGTDKSTVMAKDINPYYGSNLTNLCSAGGKLYFINATNYPVTLWSSDGTPANTNQVNDPVVNGLTDISHLTGAGNKLFFGGNSKQYGTELYEGDASATTFTAARINTSNILEENTAFNVLLYPNPARGIAALQIRGDATNLAVSIADISGKTVWQNSYANRTRIDLPLEKLGAGVYMITVKNNTDTKTIKLVKE